MESLIVSWVAVAVACLAAGFSWYTAVQSRRQADAVLGDLPPLISLFQPDDRDRAFARGELEIINHNRRPIYIERIKFDFPESMRVFRDHAEEHQSFEAIFDAVVHERRDFTFDLALRLPGHTPGERPSALNYVFNVSTKSSTRPKEAFDVGVYVLYRIDGEDQGQEESRSMTWRPLAKVGSVLPHPAQNLSDDRSQQG